MVIRQENPSDFETVYTVVKSAFDSAEQADGNEQDFVNAVRASDAYIPGSSLVAEIDGKIVGHIMFTQLKIGESTQLALAPLSVLPEYQRQGVGSALVLEGHRRARALDYEYSVVLGSEKYYPKFGYLRAKDYGMIPPFDVTDENYMACKLVDHARPVSGLVQYAKEFGIS